MRDTLEATCSIDKHHTPHDHSHRHIHNSNEHHEHQHGTDCCCNIETASTSEEKKVSGIFHGKTTIYQLENLGCANCAAKM